MNPDHLIFSHIHKTAGQSLKMIIRRHYSTENVYSIGTGSSIDDFIKLNDSERNKYKAVVGHHSFGLHNYLEGDVKYISLLRDPVKRIISFYNYYKYNSNPLMKNLVEGYSLKQFLEKVSPSTEYYKNFLFESINNGQARCFVSKNELESEFAFEKIKESIRTNFIHVGLTEQFDESIILFKKYLNWDNISYIKTNISKKKDKSHEDYDSIIEIIRSKNELDFKLYEFVSELHQKRIQEHEEFIKKEKLKLSLLNPLLKNKFRMQKQLKKIWK